MTAAASGSGCVWASWRSRVAPQFGLRATQEEQLREEMEINAQAAAVKGMCVEVRRRGRPNSRWLTTGRGARGAVWRSDRVALLRTVRRRLLRGVFPCTAALLQHPSARGGPAQVCYQALHKRGQRLKHQAKKIAPPAAAPAAAAPARAAAAAPAAAESMEEEKGGLSEAELKALAAASTTSTYTYDILDPNANSLPTVGSSCACALLLPARALLMAAVCGDAQTATGSWSARVTFRCG